MNNIINLVISILGLIGIGAILDRLLGYFLQTRREKEDKRLAVYRKLMGVKITLRQAVVSRTEAYLTSDYFEARHKLTKDKWDFDEAVRWMHKSENMVDLVTAELRELFEILGEISVLFKNNKDIQLNIDRLYRYKTLKTQQPSNNLKIEDLEKWKIKGIQQIQQLVESEYGEPIEKLTKQIRKLL